MPSKLIRQHCKLDSAGEKTLEAAVVRMGLSARAHDRILRVARTIADLEGSDGVGRAHVADALSFRLMQGA